MRRALVLLLLSCLGLCASHPLPEGIAIEVGGGGGHRELGVDSYCHVNCVPGRLNAEFGFANLHLAYRQRGGFSAVLGLGYADGNKATWTPDPDGVPSGVPSADRNRVRLRWDRQTTTSLGVGFQTENLGGVVGATVRMGRKDLAVLPAFSGWGGRRWLYGWVNLGTLDSFSHDTLLAAGFGHLNPRASVEIGVSTDAERAYADIFRFHLKPGVFIGRHFLVQATGFVDLGGGGGGSASLRWSSGPHDPH